MKFLKKFLLYHMFFLSFWAKVLKYFIKNWLIGYKLFNIVNDHDIWSIIHHLNSINREFGSLFDIFFWINRKFYIILFWFVCWICVDIILFWVIKLLILFQLIGSAWIMLLQPFYLWRKWINFKRIVTHKRFDE